MVAFVSSRGADDEIFVVNVDGSGPADISNNPASSETQPAYSPDGSRIAFTSDRTSDAEIFVMHADGSGQVNMSNSSGSSDSEPAFSPDGTRIAFTSTRTGHAEIFVMNADGTGQVNVSNSAGSSDSQPAFSPDGARIAFTSNRTGDAEIFVMNADGSGQVDLSNEPGPSDSEPAFSPDGTRIAFTSDRTGDAEIFLMNVDGSGQADFSNAPGSAEEDPVFSPNEGSRLAFTSDASGSREVTLANLTPSGGTYGSPTELTSGRAPHSAPTWQPLPGSPQAGWPIDHVVILAMENHSFDEVLGYLCVQDGRCDGSRTGQLADGTTIQLARQLDISPEVNHGGKDQVTAVNAGLMNGFSLIEGCTQAEGYACYAQYQPDQIPSLAALARQFAISDRTFESGYVASFGAHIQFVASILDGFIHGGFTRFGTLPSPS